MAILPLLLLLLCSYAPAEALVRYASSTGAGSAPCTVNANNSTACNITTAIPILLPGDVLILKDGTYNQRIYPGDFFIPSGTGTGSEAADAPWPNAITIKAETTGSVILTGEVYIQDNAFAPGGPVTYLIIEGLIVDRGDNGSSIVERPGPFRVGAGSHHVRFLNNEGRNTNNHVMLMTSTVHHIHVKGCNHHHAYVTLFDGSPPTTGMYGIYMNPRDSIVEDCQIHDNTGYGIHLFLSGATTVNDNIIRNNFLYNNGTNDGARGLTTGGMIVSSGFRNKAYNNVVHNNTGYGIQVSLSAVNNSDIFYNTVYGNTNSGIILDVTSSNNTVKNNIAYLNNPNIQNDSSSTTFNKNFCGTAVSGCQFVGNPQFQNAPLANFQLQSTSPARGVAECLGAVPNDILGVNRPVGLGCDDGPYQFQAATVGPLVSLPFDEGGGTTATSTVGGYVCNLSSAGWGSPGLIGASSFSLDGVRYCTIASTPALRPTTQFTLAGWFKASTTDSSGGTIVALPNDAAILYLNTAGQLVCQLFDGVGFSSRVSVPTYLNNTKTFASCSYQQGTGLTLRVNHTIVGFLSLNIPIDYSLGGTGNVEVGRSSGSPVDYGFIGILDQVEIRDTPLSDADDLALYQQGLTLVRRMIGTVLR